MSQEQYIMAEKESQNLQKRNQQLQDQYARLDIACNHASEELATAHSQIERLRKMASQKKAVEVSAKRNLSRELFDKDRLQTREQQSKLNEEIGPANDPRLLGIGACNSKPSFAHNLSDINRRYPRQD